MCSPLELQSEFEGMLCRNAFTLWNDLLGEDQAAYLNRISTITNDGEFNCVETAAEYFNDNYGEL